MSTKIRISKLKYFILPVLALLFSYPILKTNNVKAEEYNAGGLPLELKSDGKIFVTEAKAGDNFGPVNIGLTGTFDSSASFNLVTIKKTGLNMMAGLSIDGSPDINNSGDLMSLAQTINYHDSSTTYIAGEHLDSKTHELVPITPVLNIRGGDTKVAGDAMRKILGVSDNTPMIQADYRGDELDNAYGAIKGFIDTIGASGLKNYTGIYQIQLPVNPFYSAKGLEKDLSPNKVLTAGLKKPSDKNQISISLYFFGSSQCHNYNWLTPGSDIYLNSNATSVPVSKQVNTWSNYISPWDSKQEYNVAKPPFEETTANTALPGPYLAPVVNWSLRKDGLPSTTSVAKRFGRVIDFFTKQTMPDVKVEAKETETTDGANFELYSSDSTNRQYQDATHTYQYVSNPVNLSLKYKVITPTLDPLVTNKDAILGKSVPVSIQANAPTTNKMDIEYKYDSGEWRPLKTIDLSQEAQSTYSKSFDFPSPSSPGTHKLSVKLSDHNRVESNVQYSNINFYDNQVKFDGSLSSLSFGMRPISKDNTITINSDIKIQDTLYPTGNNGWTLAVSYDANDEETKKWEASNLSLSFSPSSDQSFINPPSIVSVNDESQLVASVTDETKKGTQEEQTIALNPKLTAQGKVRIGTYKAQLVWNLVSSPN